MSPYLNPGDPDSFLDHPLQVQPSLRPDGLGAGMQDYTVQCPKCAGHGGWNLKPWSYRLPMGMPNTACNRHLHVHFRASCSQCNGWGWVKPEDADHIHEWVYAQPLGRCYHQVRCCVCGQLRSVDSSD